MGDRKLEEKSASGTGEPQSTQNRILRRLIPIASDGIDDPEALRRAAKRRAFIGSIGVPIMAILIIVVFAITADNFLTGSNIKNIFAEAALPLIAAVGLTVCLSMGEFDLSLNGVAGVATVLIAVLVARDGVAAIPACAIVLGVGVAIGLLNGTLVGYFGVAALIVTIAVNSILNGWQFVISDSERVFGNFPEGFVNFARGDVAAMPNLVFVAAAVVGVTWIMLERTTLGRQIRAVGGNVEASRVAGVNTARVKVAGFVICAFMAALAGMLFAAKQTSAAPLSGLDILLPSFAACFIGAAMFKLGEFNVPGTVVGVMITEVIANGLSLMSVPTYANFFLQGGILLIALLFARAVAGARTV